MEQFEKDKTEYESCTAEADLSCDEGKQDIPLNKFKNIQSLQNAYSSLQSEFTKRSQKLRELERECGELKGLLETKENSFNEHKLAQKRCAEQFIKEFPEAQKFSSDIDTENLSYGENSVIVAYIRQLKNKLIETQKLLNDDNFLYDQIDRSAIKDKIIKNYLTNVKTYTNAIKLIDGGGEFTLAPPIKPKTIEEAGLYAKDILVRKN